jgi:hypothetical protein
MPAIRQSLTRQHEARTPVLVLVAAGAVTIVVSAVVHLYLWGSHLDYRSAPTVGPLFLIQAIVGCILGPTMLLSRRVFATAAGAIYMAMSIGGLYLSMHGGLFGYQETLDGPFVKLMLVVEVIGLIATIVVAAMEFRPRQVASQ